MRLTLCHEPPSARSKLAPASLLAAMLLAAASAASADTPDDFTQPVVMPAGCPIPKSNRSERWHGQHVWQALQNAGYKIGQIDVVVDNVFDLKDPKEDTWYARTADALHINTHDKAVREQLLIATGD